MQSQLAAPLRGWQVSALAFLKALGNQMRDRHTANSSAAHTNTHTYRSQEAPLVRTHRASDSAFRRTENPSEGEPGWGQTPRFFPGHHSYYSSRSPRTWCHPGVPPPPVLELNSTQIPRSPGLSPHSQIDRPTVPLPPQYPL